MASTGIAIATTVHFVKSCVSATRIPSRTAIQRTIRVRRARSQRPLLLVPCSALGVALLAAALVESLVDRGCRLLARVVWQEEDDPVVLREVECPEVGARALAELRAGGEEEGHVGPERGRELVQGLR